MHDRADLVFAEGARHKFAIADVADDQRRIAYRLAKARRKVVEHHHALAAIAQLQRDVTADIAGAARDQHGILNAHQISWPQANMRSRL